MSFGSGNDDGSGGGTRQKILHATIAGLNYEYSIKMISVVLDQSIFTFILSHCFYKKQSSNIQEFEGI